MTAREVRLVAAVMLTCLVALLPRSNALGQTSEVGEVRVDASGYPHVAVTLDVPDVAEGAWTGTVTEAGRTYSTTVETASAGSEVVLVLDTSGSMNGGAMAAAKAAAISYVRDLPQGTHVAVVGFGSSPYVASPLTDDPVVLEHSIAGVSASGETALYDALGTAVAQFSLSDRPRSIVLVSDGGDTASVTTLGAVTQRLVDARARVFGLRLVTSESNDGVLNELAAATHGHIVDAVDLDSLDATYRAIAAQARRQVRLSYRSEGHGPASLEITLASGTTRHRVGAQVVLPPAPEVAPRVIPTETPSVDEPTGESRWSLVLGGSAFFAGLSALLSRLFVPRARSLLAGARQRDETRDWGEVKAAIGAAFERALERRGRRDALGVRLEHAGVALRPGEFLLMTTVATTAAAVVGTLIGGLLLGVLLAGAAACGAMALLSIRTAKRRAMLERQLADFLQRTTSTLRAGYGVMQALDSVARDSAEPLRGELRRVVHEVQLGRSVTTALDAMATRVGGQDFHWVVQAIEINHEVGGDLIEVLDSVGTTIRARAQLRRQIRTLSGQGRLSARILIAMPFFMAFVLSLLQPGWMTPLLEAAAGRVALAFGGALLLVGALWMRRIVRLQF